jgi:hypothetical protein
MERLKAFHHAVASSAETIGTFNTALDVLTLSTCTALSSAETIDAFNTGFDSEPALPYRFPSQTPRRRTRPLEQASPFCPPLP